MDVEEPDDSERIWARIDRLGRENEILRYLLNLQDIDMKGLERMKAKFRLPDGAVFEATYNAANQTWTGTLHIPGEPLVIQNTCKGIHQLFSELGKTWQKNQSPATA